MTSMENAAMGARAAELINELPAPHRLSMEALGLSRKLFYAWRDGEAAPSARALRAMALRSMDVGYILTGKRKEA